MGEKGADKAGADKAAAALSDKAFDKLADRLRLDLVTLQQRVRKAGDFPIILVLWGEQGAGVMDTLNLLNSWMDPRWIRTETNDEPTDEEKERPFFWRYWRELPADGTMNLYLGGWYDQAAHYAVAEKDKNLGAFLARIRHFEKTLSDDGALILKLWLHDGVKGSKKHDKKDRVLGLLLSDDCLVRPGSAETFEKNGKAIIKATHSLETPWFEVDGSDDNARRATVLTLLRDTMKAHLQRRKKERGKKSAKATPYTGKKRLPALDMEKTVTDENYEARFTELQFRLRDLQDEARKEGLSTVVAIEGWDAAGKGGAIRRLVYALNPRNYVVVPIAAPNDMEKAHHYLWRFWRHLPRAGRMTLFDRTWYGRVLVERVDGLIDTAAWSRAYDEINAFEAELEAHGLLLVKFWMHVTKEEQLKRFQERRDTPHKKWKMTEDDWRNRNKWDLYAEAAEEMFARTSTKHAPWHLVPANDKKCARITVIETVADALEKALKSRKG